MNLKFTVITVVFNGESVLRKTIESVLNQEYPPFEYLIFDGNSTDGTLAIANEYHDAFRDRGVNYRVVSEPDTGIYNAMNKGIAAATGDFLSFLNAGDWYQNDTLSAVEKHYDMESFDLTYGGLNYINPNGSMTIKMSKLDKFPISSRNWNHPSMFLRREIYQKYGFNERYPAYADFELYLKLRKDGTKIRVIDKVLTNFVADGVSTKVEFDKVMARAKEKYRAYRSNGYSPVYFFEAYGWEIVKSLYFRIRS